MRDGILRIGSRKSPLAQRQVELCAEALMPHLPEGTRIERLVFETSGDHYLAGALSDIGTKGLFTKEIEHALLNDEIDIAVHSMKDMATQLPEGLTLAAMLPRDDVRDVFLSLKAPSLAELPQGAVVGTSSLRRAVQILHARPDIRIVTYRGNLKRRIDKLREGEVDATLLAAAGLDRLGYYLTYAYRMDCDTMLPAVAQGAIGLQCRMDDTATQSLCALVDDAHTSHAVNLERAFLRHLDGSCRTPIAGYAVWDDDQSQVTLHGLLADPEGKCVVRDTMHSRAEDAYIMAHKLALKLQAMLAS